MRCSLDCWESWDVDIVLLGLFRVTPCDIYSLSYNPYDGPNEHPEAELPLVAGKYLYVYGNMDDDGFYEGEEKRV